MNRFRFDFILRAISKRNSKTIGSGENGGLINCEQCDLRWPLFRIVWFFFVLSLQEIRYHFCVYEFRRVLASQKPSKINHLPVPNSATSSDYDSNMNNCFTNHHNFMVSWRLISSLNWELNSVHPTYIFHYQHFASCASSCMQCWPSHIHI